MEEFRFLAFKANLISNKLEQFSHLSLFFSGESWLLNSGHGRGPHQACSLLLYSP